MFNNFLTIEDGVNAVLNASSSLMSGSFTFVHGMEYDDTVFEKVAPLVVTTINSANKGFNNLFDVNLSIQVKQMFDVGLPIAIYNAQLIYKLLIEGKYAFDNSSLTIHRATINNIEASINEDCWIHSIEMILQCSDINQYNI